MSFAQRPFKRGVAACAAIFVVAVCAFIWVSHIAGCAGDLKSGTRGDPLLALDIEALSAYPYFAALVSAGVGLFFWFRGTLNTRLGTAGAVVLLLAAGLWVLGVSVEIEAGRPLACL
jgi:hypothetical protein